MAVASLVVKVSAQIAELQKSFNDATKTVNKFQTDTLAAAKNVAGAFGVGLGVGALVGFTKSVIDAAGETVDLANKLGISTDAVQKLQFIAGQTGTTIEAFGKAIFVLGNAVAGSDKSAAAALEKLGLSFSDLKKLAPEKQFDAVVVALAKITDAQERNAIATKLFGARNAQEIAKAVTEYEKLAKIAPIADEAQVRALEEAGDKIDAFKARLMATATQGFGAVITGAENLEKSLFPLIDAWREQQVALLNNTATAHTYADALARLRKEQENAAGAPKVPDFTPKAPSIFTPLKIEAPKLDPEFDRQQKEIEDAFKKSYDKMKAAADAYTQSVKDLRDELSGAKLQAEVKKSQEAFSGLTEEQRKNPAVMARVGEAADRLAQNGARLTADLFLTTLGIRDFDKALTNLKPGLEDIPGSLVPMQNALAEIDRLLPPLTAKWSDFIGVASTATTSVDFKGFEFPDDGFREFQAHMDEVRAKIGDVANSMRGLGSLFDNTFGHIVSGAADIVQGIGDIVTATNEWQRAMAIVNLALNVGQKLYDALFGSRGRDAVKDFAASFGGFDQLHVELNKLGDEGERLWKNLTQGVGRNNPEEAARAIEAIRNALAHIPPTLAESAADAGFQTLAELQKIADDARKVYEYMRDSGQYSAAQVARAWERSRDAQIAALDDVSKAAFDADKARVDNLKKTISDLDKHHDAIFASWKAEDDAPEFDAAGNRIFGVVEQQQRAELDRIEAERKKAEEALLEANARIDESFAGLGPSAQTAALEIVDAFEGIDITIPVHFKVDPLSIGGGSSLTVPAMADGGIVSRPTLALIGERGPEAVVPLAQYNGRTSGKSSGGSGIVFQRGAFEGMTVDSAERVEALADAIFTRVRRGGAFRTRALASLGLAHG